MTVRRKLAWRGLEARPLDIGDPGADYLENRGISHRTALRWLARPDWPDELRAILAPTRQAYSPDDLGPGTEVRASWGYPHDVAGILVYDWQDPTGQTPGGIEVEGVTAAGEHRDYLRRGGERAKRYTIEGSSMAGSVLVPRPLKPLGTGRLHVCEGAVDALSLLALDHVRDDDDVIAVHGCDALRHPHIVAICRARRRTVVWPHGGDVNDIGERRAQALREQAGTHVEIIRGEGDLNDELTGKHPRRVPGPETDSADPSSLVMSLADVRPTYQPMIWRPWLPVGGLSMIAGAPGAGKTLVMTAIAAAMTRGDPLPGEPAGTRHTPATVGWLSIEEDPEMVIAPRMHVAGAVMERVLMQRIPEAECVIGAPVVERMLDHLLRICRLVVFDSLEAWSGGAELSRPKEARRVVGWLHSQAKERRAAIAAIVEGEHEDSLAERCRQGGVSGGREKNSVDDAQSGISDVQALPALARSALCVIHHDRKAVAAESLSKVSGSRQVTAPAESVMLVVRTQGGGDPEGGQVWLAHSKCRVAAREDSWKLAIEARQVSLHDPETGGTVMGEHGAVVWQGQEAGVSAETLSALMGGGGDPGGGEDDREDAEALAGACVRAFEAGTMPEGVKDGQVNRAWLMMVADATERPSGRARSRRWHADVLGKVGVKGRLSNGDRWWSIDQIRGQCT